jgi:hypothetical protein
VFVRCGGAVERRHGCRSCGQCSVGHGKTRALMHPARGGRLLCGHESNAPAAISRMVVAAAVASRGENGGTEAFAARRNRNTEAPEDLSISGPYARIGYGYAGFLPVPLARTRRDGTASDCSAKNGPSQSAGLRAPERSRSSVAHAEGPRLRGSTLISPASDPALPRRRQRDLIASFL